MPFIIPEPSLVPTESQTWSERCPGCNKSYEVTARTGWNQCPRCEGLFCQRCVTTDGFCFSCAVEMTPHSYPCENCRTMTPEQELGAFYEGGEEQRLQCERLEADGEWEEARRRGPMTVCPKCFRSLEASRIAAARKQRGIIPTFRELGRLLDMEAGRDYVTIYAERYGEVR